MNRNQLLLFLLACYLGIHNGHLALFDEQSTAPLLILPHTVQMFSAEDQQKLAQGIEFDSPQELSRILEDFLS